MHAVKADTAGTHSQTLTILSCMRQDRDYDARVQCSAVQGVFVLSNYFP